MKRKGKGTTEVDTTTGLPLKSGSFQRAAAGRGQNRMELTKLEEK
jgi:hypothetical protein